MSERPKTKDELFILKLYEEACKLPHIDDPIDPLMIGELVGLHQKAVGTICVLLGKANFIKRHGEEGISITKNGISLAENVRLKM